jgi:site-specific DNA-methyltransferase (adenine-specific)
VSNTILHGDTFELIKTIPNCSIDLILTDPPYNISRPSNFKKGSTNKKYNSISLEFGEWDDSEVNLDYLFAEFKRILKNGGTLIIFYDVWKSNKLKQLATKFGFKQPRVCQWVKTNPVPVNSKINYLSNAIEYFFLFTKGKKNTFNSEYDKGIYNYPICHGRERTDHPTQKPIKLFQELILKHSNIGDLIIDPFAGSGTTGEACIITNRKYILFEQDTSYFNTIMERLNKYEKNL